MRSESYINAIKEDLAMGLFQDREEEAAMREEIREHHEYREHCDEMRWEHEQEDARDPDFWEDMA